MTTPSRTLGACALVGALGLLGLVATANGRMAALAAVAAGAVVASRVRFAVPAATALLTLTALLEALR